MFTGREKKISLIALSILKIFDIKLDVLSLEDFYKIPIGVLKLTGFEWQKDEIEDITKRRKIRKIMKKIYFAFCVFSLVTSTFFSECT